MAARKMVWRDIKLEVETSEVVTAVRLKIYRVPDLKAFSVSVIIEKIE